MLFASLIVGILIVTDDQQHEVHVPKTHRWWSPLSDLMRLAGPGRSLIVFTGYIQSCNVVNSVVPFLPFQGFFGRCYKSGATTTMITVFIRITNTAQQSHVLTDGFICKLFKLCIEAMFLLLTHGFNIFLPLIFGILSVTVHAFHVPKTYRWFLQRVLNIWDPKQYGFCMLPEKRIKKHRQWKTLPTSIKEKETL